MQLFVPIAKYLGAVIGFINGVLVPLVFALAFIAFMWGVYTYFIAGGDKEEQRETGRKFIMWAIIGFVVMLSLWGIIRVLMVSLGFGGDLRPNLPTFNKGSTSNSASVCGGFVQGSCPSGQTCTFVQDSGGVSYYQCQ